jgi:hypothetical protein
MKNINLLPTIGITIISQAPGGNIRCRKARIPAQAASQARLAQDVAVLVKVLQIPGQWMWCPEVNSATQETGAVCSAH